MREETCCCHMGYSFQLAARVLLYPSLKRQDNTYHSLCYASRGALAHPVEVRVYKDLKTLWWHIWYRLCSVIWHSVGSCLTGLNICQFLFYCPVVLPITCRRLQNKLCICSWILFHYCFSYDLQKTTKQHYLGGFFTVDFYLIVVMI